MSLAEAIRSATGLKKKGADDAIEHDEEDVVDENEDDASADDAVEDDEEEDAKEDDEEKNASSFKKGYASCLKRTAAILTSPHADANPQQAAKLAFGKEFQKLSASAAVEILKSAPKPGKKSTLADRMKGENHGLAADASGGDETGEEAHVSNLVLVASKTFGRNKAARKS